MQITQFGYREVVTINNNTGPFRFCNWNEYNLNHLTSNNWRVSLVPVVVVIPAPIVYIKVVAVKKLVVGFLSLLCGPPCGEHCAMGTSSRCFAVFLTERGLDSGPLF